MNKIAKIMMKKKKIKNYLKSRKLKNKKMNNKNNNPRINNKRKIDIKNSIVNQYYTFLYKIPKKKYFNFKKKFISYFTL